MKDHCVTFHWARRGWGWGVLLGPTQAQTTPLGHAASPVLTPALPIWVEDRRASVSSSVNAPTSCGRTPSEAPRTRPVPACVAVVTVLAAGCQAGSLGGGGRGQASTDAVGLGLAPHLSNPKASDLAPDSHALPLQSVT